MARAMRLPFSALAVLNETVIEDSDEEEEDSDEVRELALAEASEIILDAESWERSPSSEPPPMLLTLPDEIFVRILAVLRARAIGRVCSACRTFVPFLGTGLEARAMNIGVPRTDGISGRHSWWLARRLLEEEGEDASLGVTRAADDDWCVRHAAPRAVDRAPCPLLPTYLLPRPYLLPAHAEDCSCQASKDVDVD